MAESWCDEMERLTKRDALGDVECVIETLDCDGYCLDCNIYKIVERLAKYEDEAERREKGCGFCNGYMVLAFEGGYKLTCRTEDGNPAIVDKDEEIAVDLSESFIYCPTCGRKLVD